MSKNTYNSKLRSEASITENIGMPVGNAPELQINHEDPENFSKKKSKLIRADSQFIYDMIENSPSHTDLTPTASIKKKFNKSTKMTLPRRKSIRLPSMKSQSNLLIAEPSKIGGKTPYSEKSPLIFSKNVFNFSTKLPNVVKKRSQDFYYNIFKKRKGKHSMPSIDKTPGMLDKAQRNKYIVKNRAGMSKKFVDYKNFSYKYRERNPLSNQIKLTTGLFSKLKRRAESCHTELKIKDIDHPGIEIDDKMEIEYLKDIIPVQNNVESIDSEIKDLEGIRAVNSYYKHYKMLESIEQINQVKRTKPSVYTKLLKSTSQKRLLPMKMGVVKLGKSESCLDLRHYSLGNAYSEIACQTTNDLQFDKINLQDNRLSGEGAENFLKEIEKNVYKINLAENKLGRSVLALQEHIVDIKSNLQFLNLKKCNIGDAATCTLFSYIKQSLNLKSINLSENNLTDVITNSVADCFSKNQSVKEIYFRWNGLTSQFAGPFLRSVVESTEMMVIDLSFNHIGKGLKVIKEKKNKRRRRGRIQDVEVAEIIKEFLEDNKSVAHLDLSCNNFRYEECELIAEGLKTNHTLYGFHFDGNYGYVDSEGFLLMERRKDYSTMHGRKPIYGLEKVRHYNKLAHQVESLDTRNCCWICDGWMEMTFEYTGEYEEGQPIFILFKHEDYQPIYLSREEDDEYPCVTVMVPDARLFFFFLVDFEIRILEKNPKIFLAETDYVGFTLLEQDYEYHIEIVNLMDVTSNVPPIFNEDYYTNIDSKPRSLRKQYFPENKERRKWNFHNSIFRHFKQDTKYLLERCFESDWTNGRYRQFIKDSKVRRQIREYLRDFYKDIKDFYKHYSSFSNSKNFGLSSNLMIDLFNKMGALDNKYLNIAAVGIEMTKVNFNTKEELEEETNNPRNLICRYEFMELLVRCAHNKYILSRKEDNYYSALKRFFEEYVIEFIKGYDNQEFRDGGYWSEEVDHLYECYRSVLKYIYKKFAAEEASYNTVSMSELKSFIKTYELDKYVPAREIALIYRTSMMTIIDEIKSERVFSMTFVEFLESLARIAKKANMAPLSFTAEEAEMLTDEQKDEFNLSLKIEALIVHIVNNLSKEEQSRFKIPKNSVLTDEGKMPEGFGFDYIDLK